MPAATPAPDPGLSGDRPELPALVTASMPAPAGGRGNVTVTGVFDDGTERVLASWADAVDRFDRLLLSRSPDGGRVAVALGRFVRTLDTRDGSVIARAPIGHSEPSLIFGWPAQGAVVVRDSDARSGPDLPIGDGWTLHARGQIVQDDGFSGGFTGGAPGVMVPNDHPDPERALAEGAAQIRAEAMAQFEAAKQQTDAAAAIRLSREDRVPIAVDPGAGGSSDLHWPPIVRPDAVLLRRSGGEVRFTEPEAPGDPGVSFDSGPSHPWLVTDDGQVTTIALDLSVSPVCALPDGRYLLPGASETWRDDADEPMRTVGRDGSVEPWLPGGRTQRAGKIITALAPDLLPDVLPERPEHGMWSDDEGMWVQAGRVTDDARHVLVLLAEAAWWPDLHQPEAARWLVAEIGLADGTPRLVARGARDEGDAFLVAL